MTPDTPEALASEIESLPQFVPYVQKHRHAAKGYVVGMRRPNRRDLNDERDVYVRKDDVLNLFRRLRPQVDEAMVARHLKAIDNVIQYRLQPDDAWMDGITKARKFFAAMTEGDSHG